jgi:hypothetical protein
MTGPRTRPVTPEPSVPAGVRAQVAHYLGLVRAIERELRDALLLIADRHERNYEVSHGATTLAVWSTEHLGWLEEPITRYGAQDDDRPAKLRGSLFGGRRIGAMGELADIADLAVLVEQASMAWTILAQGAKELHDTDLLERCVNAREHCRRQLAWLRTQIEHEAPDAIAVVHDPAGQGRISMPKRPTAIASIPDAVWGPLVAGVLLLVVGGLGVLAGRPWLLPSLGPTAVLLALTPAHPTARAWNTFAGHMGGLGAGFIAIALVGAANAPVPLATGELVPVRVLAGALAVALTVVFGAILWAPHPPAAATALLVSLGSIATAEKALWVVAGVAVLTVLGEGVRRLRTERPAPAERDAPPVSELALRLRGLTTSGHPPGR